MRFLLCDDVKKDLIHIEKLLRGCCGDCEIAAFENPEDALKYIADGNAADMVFLDIFMPQMSGVEFAGALRDSGFAGALVFITTSNDFAAESYEVDAFSYLVKPVDSAALQRVLDKFSRQNEKADTAGFALKKRGSTRFIQFADLMYVEVKNHTLRFYLTGGETIDIYATMQEYADVLLADKRMVKPRQSFIINKDYISVCEKGHVIMRGGTSISITKNFTEFQKEVLRWMCGKKDI